jgi:hypothetical protein
MILAWYKPSIYGEFLGAIIKKKTLRPKTFPNINIDPNVLFWFISIECMMLILDSLYTSFYLPG